MANEKERPAKWIQFDMVARNPLISLQAKGVYMILVSYANNKGECWPGIERLAAEMGVHERTIRRSINELVEKGAITKVSRGKKLTNVYNVTGHICPPTEEVTGHICPSDRTYLSGVTGHICPSEMDSSPTAPCDSGNRTAQYNSIKEQPNILPAKTGKENVDIRVSPLLRVFREGFINHVGYEPTKAAFDYGRDGKRIKELPSGYTTEILLSLVTKFFAAQGWVTKQYSFKNFLDAIPQLIKGDAGHGKHGKPAMPPSTDFSDLR